MLIFMVVGILFSGCASQKIIKKAPTADVINSYFQNKEIEKINQSDIKKAEKILALFREYFMDKALKKLEIGANVDGGHTYAVLTSFNSLSIFTSEPSSAYEYIKMRGENLDEIEVSQYETSFRIYEERFLEIRSGYDLKSRKPSQWTCVLVDIKTGGIIFYLQKGNLLESKSLKLNKKGELVCNPPEISTKKIINEAIQEVYIAFELLDDIQKKIKK